MMDWINSQIDQVAIIKPCVKQSDFLPDQPSQLALLSALKDYATALRNDAVKRNPQDQQLIDSALKFCLVKIENGDYVLP